MKQALNAIKTVKMLDGEEFESNNYTKYLKEAAKTSVLYKAFSGFGFGLIESVLMFTYALGFWYSTKLIADGV
jgi:ATP-binding cassette subfamily B (MDR/TAP) protein 1